MALDALAPWAEPALLTANDLTARADDSWRYELVEGRLVRMPPSGYEHSHVAGRLFMALRSFVDAHELGTVTLPETGFLLSRGGEPDTVLAPDLAFIAAARAPVPGSQEWKGFPRLAPDLVVEIASPSQARPQLAAKARWWLRAGVTLVWVVWPVSHQVDVWQSREDTPGITLEETDQLDGGQVLPGFTYPGSHLFA
jgi:Uma2 family endonuclease